MRSPSVLWTTYICCWFRNAHFSQEKNGEKRKKKNPFTGPLYKAYTEFMRPVLKHHSCLCEHLGCCMRAGWPNVITSYRTRLLGWIPELLEAVLLLQGVVGDSTQEANNLWLQSAVRA